MSAGYIIYSIDAGKFRNLVERPTPEQLATLGSLLHDGLEETDEEFDEGDPVKDWPRDAASLAGTAAARLALPDWYGDLSYWGKNLWEGVIVGACMDNDSIDVGFRVDDDGVYWDVIEIAWKHLKVPPNTINDTALSAFGTRPYRYFPAPKAKKRWFSFGSGDDDEWNPMHSLHTPDEVTRMLAELKSAEPAIKASKNGEALRDYEEALMPALETIAQDGRMLFIQVDT